MVATVILTNGQQYIIDGVIQVVNCKYSVTFYITNDEFETLFHKDLEGYIVE